MDTCIAWVESAFEDVASIPTFEDRWWLTTRDFPKVRAHLRTIRGVERSNTDVTVGVINSGIDLAHIAFAEGAAASEMTEEFFLDATDETGPPSTVRTFEVCSTIGGSSGEGLLSR